MMPINITVINNADSCPKSFNESLSPFAIYPNEQLQVLFAPEVSCGSTIVRDDLEKLILLTINKMVFTTSQLLTLLLSKSSVAVEQTEIQKTVKTLCARNFLRSVRFENKTEAQRSANKVYCIGWRGYGFLKSNNVKPYLRGYIDEIIATSDTVAVKKILSAQQAALKLGVDIESLSMCEAVFVPNSPDKVFRPQAIIRGKGQEICFVESIRRAPTLWGTEFKEKLKRMIKVVKSEHFENSSLIVVCEDLDQMRNTMGLINREYLTLPFEVYYTTDTLLYSSPENSLYSLKPSFWTKLFA